MTTGKNLQQIIALQENVSGFFERFHKKYMSEMKCSSGCSRCCKTKISIFTIEAQRILNWYEELDVENKNRLNEIWKSTENESEDERLPQCAFHFDNKCTVYSARPVICRSQGVPHLVKRSESGPLEEGLSLELSLCELNFSDNSKIPEPVEWLDLDRLNSVLSLVEQQTETVELNDSILSLSSKYEGRVPLDELKKLLLQLPT